MFPNKEKNNRKSLIISFAIMLLPMAVFGQFNVNIALNPSANETDTLNICQGTTVIFQANAVAQYANAEEVFNDTTSLFTWYFGDGTKTEGFQLDSLSHSFNSGGGYYVLLRVQDAYDSVRWAKTFVKVSLSADFTGTHASTDKPICKGDNVYFTGSFEDTATWDYAIPYFKQMALPIEVSEVLWFESFLLHNAFDIGRTFNTETDTIKSVCVYMEHSALTDLEFKLRGPDSTEVLLKSVGGNDIYLGEPIDEAGNINEGLPYKYCWTLEETEIYMNTPTTATLEEGDYLPEGDFDNFQGENMNGEWTLLINDQSPEDNGFVFGWELNFNDSILLPAWKWESVFEAKLRSWMGGGISSTNVETLLAMDKPGMYGANVYSFVVYDVRWGCPQATSVMASVEKPTFELSADGGEAPVDISFTNSTNWAVGFEWYLNGDRQADATTEDANYTYEDKGEYTVWLVAESDQGCTDISDTALVTVTVPQSKVVPPNVFTPNGDDKNDRFVVETVALKEFRGYIYNRNGRRLHVWRTPEEAEIGWDGTLSDEGGMKAAEGIYFYVIKAEGKDGVEHKMNGTFYLMR